MGWSAIVFFDVKQQNETEELFVQQHQKGYGIKPSLFSLAITLISDMMHTLPAFNLT